MKTAVLVVIFFSILTVLFFRNNQTVCSNLSCISFSGVSAFRQEELYVNNSSVYRALFTDRTKKLRVEATHVAASQGPKELASSITQFQAIFEKAPAPYPGEISDRVVCDSAFLPKKESVETAAGKLTYFISYLNSRMAFGSCTKDQASYRGIVAFIYCPARSTLIRVELFAPTDVFEASPGAFTSQIRTLSCR